MKKLKLVVLFSLGILLFSSITVGGLNQKSTFDLEQIGFVSQANNGDGSEDFYFVHITDTHVKHKMFDREEITRKIFESVIENVTSFDEKPAFIVITGDLVEWGGSGVSGALNYQAFVSCLYEKDDQLYANEDYSIPVYTTPGNHDYCFNRNLRNYHRFVDRNHVDDNDRYIVSIGNLSLFFMDSGPNYYWKPKFWIGIPGAGLYDCDIEWLENELSSCSSQHKIVLMHHPAVSRRNERGRMIDVIARNREEFVELCEAYEVDLVLVGHTHHAVVYDADENWTKYENLPLNCSQNPTLYVQSDDCKEGVHYRNISIVGDDIWLQGSVELNVTSVKYESVDVSDNSPCSNSLELIQPEKMIQYYSYDWILRYNHEAYD